MAKIFTRNFLDITKEAYNKFWREAAASPLNGLENTPLIKYIQNGIPALNACKDCVLLTWRHKILERTPFSPTNIEPQTVLRIKVENRKNILDITRIGFPVTN